MKEFVAYFLLVVFLVGLTPLKELQKLPILIEHFKLHTDCESSLSFFEFLKMHYFNGDPKDEDYDEDMKLPFKVVDHSYFTFNFNVTEINSLEILFLSAYNERRNIQTKDQFYGALYLNTIWQPPRI